MNDHIRGNMLACMHCGSPNDHHEGKAPEDRPTRGDRVICAYCATMHVVTVVDERLALRQATDDEQQAAWRHPELRAFRAAAAESYTLRQALDLWRGDQ